VPQSRNITAYRAIAGLVFYNNSEYDNPKLNTLLGWSRRPVDLARPRYQEYAA
jgi:hypothetical protein